MQKVYLNIVPGGVVPDINVSQFDSGRTFQLAVMDGGVAADLTGLSVSVSGQKPDGYGFQYTEDDMVGAAHVVAVSGNIVTITTPVQMTAADGRVVCWLTLTDSDDNEISTLYFDMHVQKSPLVGVVISETELPAIIALAQEQEENAEAWAMGTRGGVPVSPDDPAYHNNSKYYMEQAEAAGTAVLEKYPKIVSDYWYIWDVDEDAYVNTGVKALGQDGQDGTDGVTPDITVTASVDDNTGTPAVTVTKTGTAENPTFALAFSNLKGEPGGGGGGGHTIYNGAGTAMADEDGLQFDGGLDVTDNSVGQKTVVSAGKKITWADAQGYVGKNLLKNKKTSDSHDGIIWTAHADGHVTAQGTTTAAVSNFFIINGEDFVLDRAALMSSGLPDGSETTHKMAIRNKSTQAWISNYGGDTAVPAGTYDRVLLQIYSNQTVTTPLDFYPMLRYADITDDTYEPWIPKNTELVPWDLYTLLGVHNLLAKSTNTPTSNNSGVIVKTDGCHEFNVTCTTSNASGAYLARSVIKTITDALGVTGLPIRVSFQYKASDAVSGVVGIESSTGVAALPTSWTAYDGINTYDSANSRYSNVSFFNWSGQADVVIYVKELCLSLAVDQRSGYTDYAMTNQQLTDGAMLKADYTDANGLVPLTKGGTGAATAADARTNLGLGTVAVLDAITTWYPDDNRIPTGGQIDTHLTYYLPQKTAVVTGYVGDTTVTLSTSGLNTGTDPLISILCDNTSGTPVAVKTKAWDYAQQTITITFDALTEQTRFIATVIFKNL